jgi:hypothetical protein
VWPPLSRELAGNFPTAVRVRPSSWLLTSPDHPDDPITDSCSVSSAEEGPTQAHVILRLRVQRAFSSVGNAGSPRTRFCSWGAKTGVEGPALSEVERGTVMKKVGLTKGGFYRHFKSKVFSPLASYRGTALVRLRRTEPCRCQALL